jgi:hypothetical protein
MKNSLLIPSKYKVIGWIIFLGFCILGFFCLTKEFRIPGFQIYSLKNINENSPITFADYNLTNEFAILGITIGLLMIVFSKERIDDEYIAVLRLKSLQWAVLVSYVILLAINFCFYGLSFLMILVYNIWTIPIVFLAKFNYSLQRLRKERFSDEK